VTLSVLDTHVHVWDPTRLDYPWLTGSAALNHSFLPPAIDRAQGQTERMVFVEASCTTPLRELSWVTSWGDTWPELTGVVANIDLQDASARAKLLDTYAAHQRVVGVRHNIQSHPDEVFIDPLFRQGLRDIAHSGLTFDACVNRNQLPLLTALLAEIPDLRVVVDHLGKPNVDEGITSESGRAWAKEITRLSALPNVFIKVSGLAGEASTPQLLRARADAFIAHAVAAFGTTRSMIGSDWPVSALSGAGGTFADWISQVQRATGSTDAEWEELSYRTGAVFYRLDESSQTMSQ